jgi:hypothetical protein
MGFIKRGLWPKPRAQSKTSSSPGPGTPGRSFDADCLAECRDRVTRPFAEGNVGFDHLERIGRNRLGMDGYEHRRRNILGPNFRDTSRNAGSS